MICFEEIYYVLGEGIEMVNIAMPTEDHGNEKITISADGNLISAFGDFVVDTMYIEDGLLTFGLRCPPTFNA